MPYSFLSIDFCLNLRIPLDHPIWFWSNPRSFLFYALVSFSFRFSFRFRFVFVSFFVSFYNKQPRWPPSAGAWGPWTTVRSQRHLVSGSVPSLTGTSSTTTALGEEHWQLKLLLRLRQLQRLPTSSSISSSSSNHHNSSSNMVFTRYPTTISRLTYRSRTPQVTATPTPPATLSTPTLLTPTSRPAQLPGELSKFPISSANITSRNQSVSGAWGHPLLKCQLAACCPTMSTAACTPPPLPSTTRQDRPWTSWAGEVSWLTVGRRSDTAMCTTFRWRVPEPRWREPPPHSLQKPRATQWWRTTQRQRRTRTQEPAAGSPWTRAPAGMLTNTFS